MAGDERARELAAEAGALAASVAVELPADLALWRLAGGRPRPVLERASGHSDPEHRTRAAWDLVEALGGRLSGAERRRGAHYTPAPLADEVAAAAGVGAAVRSVVDPACGGGALLLAAAGRLSAGDGDRAAVARTRLFGADIDPLAVAVAEAAVALWSGGTAPAPGHLVVADALLAGRGAWPAGPPGGFGAVVGNPPFQGQLARETARD